jgi:hypothetical protein
MEIKIKPIKVPVDKLVKGKLYVDKINNDNPENMVVLEFVGYKPNGNPYFKAISEDHYYDLDNEGYIGFMVWGDDWDELENLEITT